tara:strand:+ start:76 stop:267 length:192 start_codon:yes stop_codon:yes gene_type:complete
MKSEPKTVKLRVVQMMEYVYDIEVEADSIDDAIEIYNDDSYGLLTPDKLAWKNCRGEEVEGRD